MNDAKHDPDQPLVGRRALPREETRPLSYDDLVVALRTIGDGEPEVFVAVTLGRDDHPDRSRLDMRGPLSLRPYLSGYLAAIGSCARMLLLPHDVTSSRLKTFDGNDFFRIVVTLPRIEIVIGDPDSMEAGDWD